ncbi:phenylacetate--CoA ligase family protein [Candidatus Woesebacteria bacterium]|nr:phenylacetate--CoA ligase family protein [Candidatus Woesebacteria bacterium]
MSKNTPSLPGYLQDPPAAADAFRVQSEKKWLTSGEKRVLKLFHQMSERIPAYADYLYQHGVKSKNIKTIHDFSKEVPTIDKENYLNQYSLEDLSWDGRLKNKSFTISSTSGSTGKPFYFPREDEQDEQYSVLAELYLRTNFKIHERSTLYIIGFPLGPWIGGIFTYQALKKLIDRGGYALSIATPGINSAEIIRTVQELGGYFDQIIIGSYAPFLKDILDEGERAGLDWSQYDLGFIFSAEVFSENFRNYIARKTNIKNVCIATLNHYGTVDMGTMSYETPISILTRRLALQHNSLFSALFGDSGKLPTLTQYIPDLHYFESVNDTLLCSSYSGIPLVRYDLKDKGGVFSLQNLKNNLKDAGVDFQLELQKHDIESTVWNLPFVYVYERADFSVSYYAFFVYPETIRKAVQSRLFEEHITGKFSMESDEDEQSNPVLRIHVELKEGVKQHSVLEERLIEQIHSQLVKESSEYAETFSLLGDKIRPRVQFWRHAYSKYFEPGIKQKWVVK